MKRKFALVLALFMVLMALAGCNTRPSSSGGGTAPSGSTADGGDAAPTGEAPEVVILVNAGDGDEPYANVVRDQLTKAGFNPVVSLQPDYASWRAQVDAGNFDLAVAYWVTTTGAPDYAVRPVFHSNGDFNLYGINDPKLDELIEKASTQTADEYMPTYNEIEDYMVEEMAYVLPIYVSMKTLTYNSDLLEDAGMHVSKSRSMIWETVRFKDAANNDTLPYTISQLYYDLTPMDPVRSDDSSTFTPISNSYIRLINLTDRDELTIDSTLTRAYGVADNGCDFYFLLRDDVNFSKVENGTAVDTGELVSAEDVVYSIQRMMDKDCVPDHKNYASFEAVDSAEIVTDLEALGAVKTGDGKSMLDVLQAGASSDIAALTDVTAEVDNAGGTYQVVRMSTSYAYPQILNSFAHSSGGIVSKKQIELINADFLADPAAYDVKTDVLYGEQSWFTEGDGYNNTMVCSGPYIPVKKTDYEVVFERNPAYMPTESEFSPTIKTVDVKFIKDSENALSALRAGELHALYNIPTSKIEVVQQESFLSMKEIDSNAFNYCAFNFKGKFADVNLRKAAQYAVDQVQLSAVFNNRLIPTYSPLTPVLGTGKSVEADAAKSAEYLKLWQES
ncbi:ABC transporter substrate-binding protein [Ruminococcaceae bacterium OttesenSCG-928-D13]|nr:ABC transporter substrate-binding protein [Ruminococcaceae bacterium OttesenSCG-928-D13]